MTTYFLGVDVGGTKTHTALADDKGRVLAFRSGAGGNPAVTGFPHLTHLNQQIVNAVCDDAGIRTDQITGAVFGIAGFDWLSQMPQFRDTARVKGLTESAIVTNDAMLGLAAGSTNGWGICLIAGTSFNCRGRTLDGRRGRVIGDGMLWGEGAGSLELATYGVQAVAAEWTKRGEPTILTEALVKFYDYPSVARLIEDLVLFRHRIEPDFAQIVIEVAQSGDGAALDCVRRAAEALASLASGVIRQLQLQDEAFEIVLAGSLFKAGDILIRPLEKHIHALARQVSFVHLQSPPVAGAIVLAMQQSGHYTQGVREALLSNLDSAVTAASIL